MKIIIRITNKATHKIIDRIKNLKISKICGKNVLQAKSLICRAITRLGIKKPSDINDIELRIYKTISYTHSNEIFKLMELNKRLGSSIKYSIQEITLIVNLNYQEILDTDEWKVPDSDTLYNASSNNNKTTMIPTKQQ